MLSFTRSCQTVFLESTVSHPHQPSALGVVTVLDSGHSTVCGSKYFTVVFISSVMYDIEHIFMYFFENLHIFFGGSCLLPFFNLIFHFLIAAFWVFCILWLTVLHQIRSFANSFSRLWFLLSFFDSVFSRGECFQFNKAQFMDSFFHSCAFAAVSKNSSPYPRSSRVPPYSIFWKFHNFAFCHWGPQSAWVSLCEAHMVCARTFLVHVDVQLFWHHLLKWSSFLHCIAFAPCQRSVDCIYVGLFLGSLSHSIDLFICSFANTAVANYCNYAVISWKYQSSNFVLLSIGYSGSFALPHKL